MIALPERLLCIPFNRPYAGLVLSGRKPIETRGRPWRYEPGWIAIYATAKAVELQREVPDRERLQAQFEEPETAMHVAGVVWIRGSAPLKPADFPDSLFYEEGRHAWACERPHRLQRLLTRAEVGLPQCPRGPVFIDGRIVQAAGLRPC